MKTLKWFVRSYVALLIKMLIMILAAYGYNLTS